MAEQYKPRFPYLGWESLDLDESDVAHIFSRENMEAACRHYDALASAAPESEEKAYRAAAVRSYVNSILNG